MNKFRSPRDLILTGHPLVVLQPFLMSVCHAASCPPCPVWASTRLLASQIQMIPLLKNLVENIYYYAVLRQPICPPKRAAAEHAYPLQCGRPEVFLRAHAM
jgi:hypothetical protein